MKKFIFILVVFVSLTGCMQKNETTELSEPSPSPEIEIEYHPSFKVVDSDITGFDDGYYKRLKAFVEVENTGDVTLLLRDAVFDIESDGLLLSVINSVHAYPKIIKPGEKAVFFFFERHDFMLNYHGINTIKPHIRYEIIKDEPTIFPVSDQKFYNYDQNDLYILGRVENNTDTEVDNITVSYIARDENNNIVYAGNSYISFISSQDKVGYQDVIRASYNELLSVKTIEACAYKSIGENGLPSMSIQEAVQQVFLDAL